MNEESKEYLTRGEDKEQMERLRSKGEALKTDGQLQDALHCYKEALDYAETHDQKIEVWNLILHIHTDRMLATCQELAELHGCDVSQIDWNWGTHKIPSNYNRPPEEELLK